MKRIPVALEHTQGNRPSLEKVMVMVMVMAYSSIDLAIIMSLVSVLLISVSLDDV